MASPARSHWMTSAEAPASAARSGVKLNTVRPARRVIMRAIPRRKRSSEKFETATWKLLLMGKRPVCICTDAGTGIRFSCAVVIASDAVPCAETAAGTVARRISISNRVMSLCFFILDRGLGDLLFACVRSEVRSGSDSDRADVRTRDHEHPVALPLPVLTRQRENVS